MKAEGMAITYHIYIFALSLHLHRGTGSVEPSPAGKLGDKCDLDT